MTNSSLTFDLRENGDLASQEYVLNNSTENPKLISSLYVKAIIILIISILTAITFIFGIVGNGTVIWFLGFCMKRNPFTTYILNLAIADIGVLIASSLSYIFITVYIGNRNFSLWGFYISAFVYSIMYISDQLFLTAISIDRCVAILFPLWHRCHRPPRLPTIACVCIWILSFLINGSGIVLPSANHIMLLPFIVNVAICTPLMAVSTIILFVKICTKSQQRKRGKLLTAILLALFFFLLFGFPVNYVYFLTYYYILDNADIQSLIRHDFNHSDLISTVSPVLDPRLNMILIPSVAAVGGAVLNCSVNPVIYFLVGRKKKGRSRQSMKFALQRVFMEEENCRGQQQPRAETQF